MRTTMLNPGWAVGVVLAGVMLAALLSVAGIPISAAFIVQVGLTVGVVAGLFLYRAAIGRWLMRLTARRYTPAPSIPAPQRMIMVGTNTRLMTFDETITALHKTHALYTAAHKEREGYKGRVNTLTQTQAQWKAEALAQQTKAQANEKGMVLLQEAVDERDNRITALTTALATTEQARDAALTRLQEAEARYPTTPKPTTWEHALAFAAFIRKDGATANWVAFRDAVRQAGYVIRSDDIAAMQAAVVQFQSLPSVVPSITPSPPPEKVSPVVVELRSKPSGLKAETGEGSGSTEGTEGRGSRKALRPLPRKRRNPTRKGGG